MALVELYRTTGDRRHLELARRMVDLRGHGLLGAGPVRAGLLAGPPPGPRRAPRSPATPCARCTSTAASVDLAVELGDRDLLASVLTRWHDMIETRTYLTGGLGSRHNDEAFGDPYELPPDLAYAETCAAIASVMLAWRLLLATGDPALRGPHRADDLQRRPAGRVGDGDRVLLRQHAPAAHAPRPDGRGVRRAAAVVRLRVLPAERHAAAQLVGAVPRDRPTTAGSRSTSTPTRSCAPMSRADRSACGSRPTTRGAAR